MGSGFSSNKSLQTLTEENELLKKKCQIHTRRIDELNSHINLLITGQSSDMCIKNNLVCNMEDDSLQNIKDVKKHKDYEYLVFSGGGIKGVSYAGALEALEELGILTDKVENRLLIKGAAGTSAGSIVAALLAVGYSVAEIKKIQMNLDMNSLFDDKIGVIRDTVNLFKDYGVAPGDFIFNYLGKLIEDKTGDANYTFKQLYNDKKFKLVVVGTDLNTNSSIYFCHDSENRHYSEISIRRAIRVSMSVPLMFEPVKLCKNYCVDGGVLDNFPLHVFDGKHPGDINSRLNLCVPNPKVLGINIMVDNELASYEVTPRRDINDPISYLMSYVTTFMVENERRIMTPSYWHRTANIVTPNYPLTDFSLSNKQKEELVKRGYDYVMTFFADELHDVELD